MSGAKSTVRMAEAVAETLRSHGVEAIVIGAIALAAHRYVRYTDDIDLGVNADVATLRVLVEKLRGEGFGVELREPDANDPLGGVVDVSGPAGLVQIISYADRFPAVIEDALAESTLVVHEGSALRIVPVAHLIALKLYAGGFKSRADIMELIRRNPELDLNAVRDLCRRYRLAEIDEWLREVDGNSII
jgi:hypothetical protein